MLLPVRVCLLLVMSICVLPPSFGQDVPKSISPAGQQPAGTPKQISIDPKTGLPLKENPLSASIRYQMFIQQIAGEEACVPKCPTPEEHSLRTDFIKILGLHPSEQDVIRILAIQAENTLKEIGPRLTIAMDAYHYHQTPENDAAWRSILRERDRVALGYAANLREQLGSEDFKKLDDFLWDSGAIIFFSKPGHTSPYPRFTNTASR